MVTYYVALGRYVLKQFDDGSRRPVIYLSGRELYVTVSEYILWNALLWNIQNYDALKADCLHKAQQFGVELSEAGFEQTLNRLLLRGLVRKGQGFTAVAALFELLVGTDVIAVRLSAFQKALGFLRLLWRGYPLRTAIRILKPDRMEPSETEIWRSLSHRKISARKLLGSADLPTGCPVPLSSTAQEHLAAIANLYLKRKVILDESK